MSALLAVDGGQSALRMGLVSEGRIERVVEADGFSHGTGDDVIAVAEAVSAARAALATSERVERICLGLTGAPADREQQRRLGAVISERLDGAAVALGGDMVTAHAGALSEPGVVAAAGTGVIVLGLAADGTAYRGDGLGFLLGDAGSGFAIGRAAARAALAAREARGPATALQDAAAAFFGPLDRLPRRIYCSPAPARELAAFTPEVARIARAGDPVARAIFDQAVADLTATTASVIRRTFPEASPDSVKVSHSGRLFRLTDLVLRPFVAALAAACPAGRHVEPLGDSLTGAARLVQYGLGPYAPLMHTTPGRAG